MSNEWLRPWKLATLGIGVALLIAGSFYYNAPDWDINISLIMALLTYFTAPWSAGVLLNREWRRLPLVLFWYWLSVDGCYWLYWTVVDAAALEMREANFYASTCLYWLCGFIWLYRGSLRQLINDIDSARRRSPPDKRPPEKIR